MESLWFVFIINASDKKFILIKEYFMAGSIANFVNSQAAVRGGHVDVGFLVDNSGSMSPYADAVTGAVKELMKKVAALGERSVKGNFIFSEFSATYNQIVNKPYAELSKSPYYRFSVDSYTCLYDSIAAMITDVERNIENAGPTKGDVIIPILTDGQDTGCKMSAEKIKELINTKTEQGWKFILLGSDSETGSIAQQIGINKELAITFDTKNMKEAIDFVGNKIEQVSKGRKLQITQQERLLLEGSTNRKNEL